MPKIVVFDFNALIDEHGNLLFPQKTADCFKKLHDQGISIKIVSYHFSKETILSSLNQQFSKFNFGLELADIYTSQDLHERHKECFEDYNTDDFLGKTLGSVYQDSYRPPGVIRQFLNFENKPVPTTLHECQNLITNSQIRKTEIKRLNYNPLLNVIRKDQEKQTHSLIPLSNIVLVATKPSLHFVLHKGHIGVTVSKTININKPSAKFLDEALSAATQHKKHEELYGQLTGELRLRLSWTQEKNSWTSLASKTVITASQTILKTLESSQQLPIEEKLKSLYFTLQEQKDLLAKAPRYHFLIGNPKRAVTMGLTNIQTPLSKISTQEVVRSAKTSYYLKVFQTLVNDKTASFKKTATATPRINTVTAIETNIEHLTYANKEENKFSENSQNFKNIHSYLIAEREKLLETDSTKENFAGYGRHSHLHKLLNHFITKIEEIALKADIKLSNEMGPALV